MVARSFDPGHARCGEVTRARPLRRLTQLRRGEDNATYLARERRDSEAVSGPRRYQLGQLEVEAVTIRELGFRHAVRQRFRQPLCLSPDWLEARAGTCRLSTKRSRVVASPPSPCLLPSIVDPLYLYNFRHRLRRLFLSTPFSAEPNLTSSLLYRIPIPP